MGVFNGDSIYNAGGGGGGGGGGGDWQPLTLSRFSGSNFNLDSCYAEKNETLKLVRFTIGLHDENLFTGSDIELSLNDPTIVFKSTCSAAVGFVISLGSFTVNPDRYAVARAHYGYDRIILKVTTDGGRDLSVTGCFSYQ
jgi:hypothetical protein